ncbi:hypothetical protein BESB_027320 [Besnoitia besnoiti]|uniref:Microneme protein MIC5-like domain-containing protein n=1 Tax=Besnoitia besnoiti TaxID=94643 RepID=A0A2A9M6P0_BESBE|nr:uncharacterized protein BESB_027320 [Besnoitia besnoiti]PFH31297.1 hypothetical protein BESB_027320 [Besnoitia besnoiti]
MWVAVASSRSLSVVFGAALFASLFCAASALSSSLLNGQSASESLRLSADPVSPESLIAAARRTAQALAAAKPPSRDQVDGGAKTAAGHPVGKMRFMVTDATQGPQAFSQKVKDLPLHNKIVAELKGNVSVMSAMGITIIEVPSSVSDEDLKTLITALREAGGLVEADSPVGIQL